MLKDTENKVLSDSLAFFLGSPLSKGLADKVWGLIVNGNRALFQVNRLVTPKRSRRVKSHNVFS